MIGASFCHVLIRDQEKGSDERSSGAKNRQPAIAYRPWLSVPSFAHWSST